MDFPRWPLSRILSLMLNLSSAIFTLTVPSESRGPWSCKMTLDVCFLSEDLRAKRYWSSSGHRLQGLGFTLFFGGGGEGGGEDHSVLGLATLRILGSQRNSGLYMGPLGY